MLVSCLFNGLTIRTNDRGERLGHRPLHSPGRGPFRSETLRLCTFAEQEDGQVECFNEGISITVS